MRTFIYPSSQSYTGNEIKIGLLGSCRLTDAFERLCDQKLIRRGGITIGSYLQTPAQSLQRLEWCLFKLNLPERFDKFIFDHDLPIRHEDFKKEIADLDVILIEVSTLNEIVCDGFYFQENYFAKNFSKKIGAPILPWLRSFDKNSPPDLDVIESIISQISNNFPPNEVENIRYLMEKTKRHIDTSEEIKKYISALPISNKVRLGLISRYDFTRVMPDQSDPYKSKEILSITKDVALSLNLKYFEATDLILSHGIEFSLDKQGIDVDHYSPEFTLILGPAYCSFIDSIIT